MAHLAVKCGGGYRWKEWERMDEISGMVVLLDISDKNYPDEEDARRTRRMW